MLAEDTDTALVTVTLFRSVVDSFKAACREKRFLVRDFECVGRAALCVCVCVAGAAPHRLPPALAICPLFPLFLFPFSFLFAFCRYTAANMAAEKASKAKVAADYDKAKVSFTRWCKTNFAEVRLSPAHFRFCSFLFLFARAGEAADPRAVRMRRRTARAYLARACLPPRPRYQPSTPRPHTCAPCPPWLCARRAPPARNKNKTKKMRRPTRAWCT